MTESQLNQQVEAYLNACAAIAETVANAKEIPAGHIWAFICDKMSIDTFEHILGTLIKAKLVKRDKSHLLHWIGPERLPREAFEPKPGEIASILSSRKEVIQ